MQHGVYETWARRITHWGTDPTVDLSDLPAITTDMFPPATFTRLFRHIDKATTKIYTRWENDLIRSLKTAQSENDIAHLLTQSRALLYTIVELAQHPSLPQEVHEVLMKDTTTSITSMQQQLEDAVAEHTHSSTITPETLLSIVKNTPLTAVLDPHFRNNTAINEILTHADNAQPEPQQPTPQLDSTNAYNPFHTQAETNPNPFTHPEPTPSTPTFVQRLWKRK